MPIHVAKELNAYQRMARRLTQSLGREPTIEELAASLQRPVEDILRMLRLSERATSIDRPIRQDSERSVSETIADEVSSEPFDWLLDENIADHVAAWLQELDDKQREVIVRRFGLLGYEMATLDEVGRALGVTRERARQIQAEALRILRRMLESRGYTEDALLGG